jgi:VanZ family protein
MFFQHNLLTIIWSVVIIVLCCIPGKEFPKASFFEVPHLDKIVHFSLYFVLIVFTTKDFLKQNKWRFLSKHSVLYSLVYGITLGIIIEVLQHYFIPFRDGNLLDAMANVLGSFLGLLFVRYKLLPNYFLVDN